MLWEATSNLLIPSSLLPSGLHITLRFFSIFGTRLLFLDFTWVDSLSRLWSTKLDSAQVYSARNPHQASSLTLQYYPWAFTPKAILLLSFLANSRRNPRLPPVRYLPKTLSFVNTERYPIWLFRLHFLQVIFSFFLSAMLYKHGFIKTEGSIFPTFV